MSNCDNPYDKKADKLSSVYTAQIVNIYRTYGEYYTGIVRTMSDKIFNWAFTLNTGGLAITISFLGAVLKWRTTAFKGIYPFLIPMIIFAFGIILIVIAAICEHRRFAGKGELLENDFEEFNNCKITAQELINKMSPKIKHLDTMTPLLEKGSYVLFLIALVVSIIFLMIAVDH